MKVLHLTTHLNTGGITTYILKLIKPLKSLGIDIVTASSGGEYEDAFIEAGSQHIRLPIRTKNELHPKLYWALAPLLRLVKNENIDLIHAHTRVTQVMGTWLQFFTGVPMVTTCHGFYKPRLGRKLFPAWGQKVIAISEGVGGALDKVFSVPLSKIAIVHNAVNLEELDEAYSKHDISLTRAEYGVPINTPVIGVVARLVEDKGHEYLMKAVAALSTEYPGIKLLIVGDGRHRQHLEKSAKDLGLEKNVLFLGNVRDVTKPLAAMDIFVLPATWREGFGLSIIEAMTCRKPIIVTNIWALNTLIQDGVTGLMVSPKEVQPLINAIRHYLQNPDFRETIAANARNMVKERFSIDRMAKEIRQVYVEASRRRDT